MAQNLRILVTFPTLFEAKPFLDLLNWPSGVFQGDFVEADQTAFLEIGITGVGMVSTAIELTRRLSGQKYDWVIQAGIAGTFSEDIHIGSVVEVRSDCFPELGAASPDGFLTIESLGFTTFSAGEHQFYNSFPNPFPSVAGFRGVRGVTVNTVSGTQEGIKQMKQKWDPEVESMETAAFFQTCWAMGVSFTAFRAISNRVEPRNTANWRIHEATKALAPELARAIIQFLHEN